MEYIKRDIENTVRETAHTFKALLLTGSRQVGKSTLLEHLFGDIRRITFDDPVLLAQAKQEPQLFIDDNKPPVLFDEIQYAASLFPYIKMVCDKSKQKGLYYLTGSQQFHMMKNVSETLAGRVGILELSPLSLREIQKVDFRGHFLPTEEYLEKREKSAKPYGDIWEVVHRGGYPELQDPDVPWERFFGSYLKTYIERDINQLEKVKDQLKFTQFLTAIAARTAGMLNYQNVADQLEISLNTVKNWISLLEATGLIFILQPFTHSALNRAIKTPKLYFRDTGLVCYLTKWSTPETAKNGAMAGSIFETFAVSEILKSFSNEGHDYRMHVTYYRGKDKVKKRKNGEEVRTDSEIDLIIEENGICYPIEIKMTANPKAEMTAAFEVLDKIPEAKRGAGGIVCLYDRPLTLRENVRAIPVNYL
ncbi:MAG: ATP-binding protein [Clostridiales Family XIII bacterium]|nr:ATP-binding protein [Clostridiales Family XIII bacterium]